MSIGVLVDRHFLFLELRSFTMVAPQWQGNYEQRFENSERDKPAKANPVTERANVLNKAMQLMQKFFDHSPLYSSLSSQHSM